MSLGTRLVSPPSSFLTQNIASVFYHNFGRPVYGLDAHMLYHDRQHSGDCNPRETAPYLVARGVRPSVGFDDAT